MPRIPLYPAVIPVSLVVAAASSYFAGIQFTTALVLVASGVLTAGFAAHKPTSSNQEANLAQKAAQWSIAWLFRVAIGAAIIATATVLVLLATQ